MKHVLTYESDHFNLGFNINLILLAQLRINNKHRYRQSLNVNQVNLTISMSLHDKKLLRDQKFLKHDSLFTSYYHYYLLSFFSSQNGEAINFKMAATPLLYTQRFPILGFSLLYVASETRIFRRKISEMMVNEQIPCLALIS